MKRKELTFEEFTKRNPTPNYNNFFAYFISEGLASLFYRTKPNFEKFQKEYPELEKEIRESISKRDRSKGTSESLKPFDYLLYQAYLKMREHVNDSKEELFS